MFYAEKFERSLAYGFLCVCIASTWQDGVFVQWIFLCSHNGVFAALCDSTCQLVLPYRLPGLRLRFLVEFLASFGDFFRANFFTGLLISILLTL